MDDTNLPITGICIVTKPNHVPTGYQCIQKVSDEPSRNADLMADSMFDRKDRFLCITRAYPLAGNNTLVLEDIKLINERDTPLTYYTALTQTVDTLEKGTTKRTICVKLVQRQAGTRCICDIIFLCRSKRPPQSYTLIGEINGLQMCVKEGTVPPLRPSSNLYPNVRDYNRSQSTDNGELSHANPLSKKSDEKEILDGIPFEINPKYLVDNRTNANDFLGIDSFQILSSYELEQVFNYDFNLERSAAL